MTRELVSSWFSKISVAEQNLPLLIVGTNAYTPRMAYDEVMRGSPLGDQLQALIEKRSFGTTISDAEALAKLRLNEIMRTKPDKPLFATLSGKVFTPAQLMQEIQQGTEIGRQWISGEISHMTRIIAVR